MAPTPVVRPPYLRYAVLAILFAISLVYQIRVTETRIGELANGQATSRLPFDVDLPTFAVAAELPESQAAGLRVGDRVTHVNGVASAGADDLFPPILNTAPGQQVTLGVSPPAGSGRSDFTATVRLEPVRSRPPNATEWLAFTVAVVALPFLCLALGYWVAVVRIRDPLAWLVLLMLLGLSQFGGASFRDMFGRVDWFHPIASVYQPVLANLWPLSMMLFGIYFPKRLAFDRRYPWAKWMVIAPILFRVVGTNVVTDILTLHHAAQAARVAGMFAWMQPVVSALHFLAISLFFAAVGYKFVAEKQPDARRRLRLLYTGSTIAITPLLVAFILRVAGTITLSEGVVTALLVVLFIFPLTMAYVVVVERAMDVRVVIRQGLQYLLARGSIRVFQIVGSIAIFAVAVTYFPRGPLLSGTSLARILPIGIGVLAIVIIGRFSDRLRGWVDRRFFREAYNAEHILADLAAQVRTIVETQPLLETVTRQISSALHVPRLAILVNSAGVLQPAFAVGYPSMTALPLPAEGTSIQTDPGLRAALDAELVLPLTANRKLVGVMGLGPKQSEEPFTPSDVRLLDAVATQTGLALENSRLTVQIAAEIAEREKRRRELEIAREVQQHLFPQQYPVVNGLEIAGACRPALAIGGDYYDFVLSGGLLGIVIGDISGKGIPASLLMATLRAYLRSQTLQPQEDLGAMISNLNALVYESSASNRYATFFYAQYNPTTRVLDYVNAGHNPPLIFRQSTTEVTRLQTGGTVIGLLPSCAYEQGQTTLGVGDLLVSFTDGVSEAMNSEMEEWGEEQLIETVMPARSLPLTELIARIMAGADAHTGTAPQHDDMTLVLARCVGEPG